MMWMICPHCGQERETYISQVPGTWEQFIRRFWTHQNAAGLQCSGSGRRV